MRQHLKLAPLVLGLLVGTSFADSKKKDTRKPVDLKPVLDELNVYKDVVGRYYVAPDLVAKRKLNEEDVFYSSDGKSFYRQLVVGYGATGGRFDWTLIAPRAIGLRFASMMLGTGELSLQCRREQKRPLTQLSTNEARKVLAKAQFFEAFWTRRSEFLARDDDGTYYYVDRINDANGGGGHRVFVGKKGAMKELAMTNLVSDSAGNIYATKAGELKFITENGGKAFWKKGGKKTELVVLPTDENRYLIYRELGIYGLLNMVCDDQ